MSVWNFKWKSLNCTSAGKYVAFQLMMSGNRVINCGKCFLFYLDLCSFIIQHLLNIKSDSFCLRSILLLFEYNTAESFGENLKKEVIFSVLWKQSALEKNYQTTISHMRKILAKSCLANVDSIFLFYDFIK